MYIYIYSFIYTHIHTYVCMYVCMYIYIHIYIQLRYLSLSIHIYRERERCMYSVCVCMYIHICIYVHMYVLYMNTCMHMSMTCYELPAKSFKSLFLLGCLPLFRTASDGYAYEYDML